MTKKIAALLAITGLLSVVLLLFDSVLRSGAPTHYDTVIIFALVDFGLAAVVAAKSSRTTLMLAVAWSALQILLEIGDITQASVYQFSSYAQFADYLFNPLSATATSLGNPLGIPGAVLDLSLLLQLITAVQGWRASKAKNPA